MVNKVDGAEVELLNKEYQQAKEGEPNRGSILRGNNI